MKDEDNAKLRMVRCCHVEMKGKDGCVHCLTLEASSLYDAADRAISSWARLWWFDSGTVVTVQSSDEVWHVRQDDVRRWRQKSSKT